MKQRRRGLWLAMIKQMLKTSEKETSKLFNVCGIKWIILEESNLLKLFRRKPKQQTDKKAQENRQNKSFFEKISVGVGDFINPFCCAMSWVLILSNKNSKLFSPEDKLFCYCFQVFKRILYIGSKNDQIMLTTKICQFNFTHYELACGENILKQES